MEDQRLGAGARVGHKKVGAVEHERLGPLLLGVRGDDDLREQVEPLSDQGATALTGEPLASRGDPGPVGCLEVGSARADRDERGRYLPHRERVAA